MKNLERVIPEKMHVEMDNRCDYKWAHPEGRGDGNFLFTGVMEMGDWVRMDISKEERIAAHKAWTEGMEEPSFNSVSQELRDSVEYSFLECERTCPEEPDAPSFTVFVTRPKDCEPDEKLPVIFNIVGGGLYQGGDCNMYIGGNIEMAAKYHAIIVSATYRNAIHEEYPAAINDCHAAYLWILDHLDEWNADREKVLLYGLSTGGHLVLSLSFRLKRYDYHGVKPRGVICFEPVMDDILDSPSGRISFRNEADGGRIDAWDAESTRWAFRMWLGERYADKCLPPEAVPSRATVEDMKGLPPIWFPAVYEMDGARDAAIEFASRMFEARNFCDLHVWGGTSHGLTWGPLHTRVIQVVDNAVRDAINYDFSRSWLNEK